MRIDTIQEFAGAWKDDEAFHAYTNNHFAERVNAFHPLRQLQRIPSKCKGYFNSLPTLFKIKEFIIFF